MGKVKRLIAVASILAIVVVTGLAILILRTGYTIQEMDWDSNGKTTISEMLRAIDIGRRPIMKEGQECQEYFHFKDGLPVRVVCPVAPERALPTTGTNGH
ncbi:MAG: hypothetical protein FWD62_01960 [Betaproteobacteria bacterium]|nr:hypothetical protein [Betaproteobacteria bacterium]